MFLISCFLFRETCRGEPEKRKGERGHAGWREGAAAREREGGRERGEVEEDFFASRRIWGGVKKRLRVRLFLFSLWIIPIRFQCVSAELDLVHLLRHAGRPSRETQRERKRGKGQTSPQQLTSPGVDRAEIARLCWFCCCCCLEGLRALEEVETREEEANAVACIIARWLKK